MFSRRSPTRTVRRVGAGPVSPPGVIGARRGVLRAWRAGGGSVPCGGVVTLGSLGCGLSADPDVGRSRENVRFTADGSLTVPEMSQPVGTFVLQTEEAKGARKWAYTQNRVVSDCKDLTMVRLVGFGEGVLVADILIPVPISGR